ncbi:hydantoinase/oxoprolinase family protein [Chitinasiproducens palmae]|uniref:N-methylhydantoinase A n=1 Tax=Chitinasiproducens palmae TaxID=1770053 RepID=A0A1H2PVB2_9BURK|nr:hydantoinase/oxoprolinase family protein [Chitinasiproducens palmae]SDV51187.1 N-methylhydantoinase A [Chitinasiproducens palmae]
MTVQAFSATAAPATTHHASRCRVGIDIGGTFTDFVLEADGSRFTHKVLTTPQAPEQGVLAGLGVLLARAGIAPGALDAVLHGTTLATNALLERRGARSALLTTEGFRDVIETGTESRCDQYDLMLGKGAPLIERDLRFVVPERVDARGQVLLPLDVDAVAGHARRIAELGVASLAIAFMHSYANPAHERAAAEIVARHAPGVAISLSSDVSPEIREFERFSTTCVNAYVQPLMQAYVERLHVGLAALGVRAPLLLMLSNGGLCDVATACRYPVRLLESGPAGGALLAARLAQRHGFDAVLSLDIGGTTAKLCFIDHGEPQTARSLEVARHYRFKPGSGIPLRIPVIELAEIGAGGGSIARVDALGRVTVGPDSAGSAPGPACYGRGGVAATLTDAHLHAGRLDPRYFAAGTLALDAAAARRVIAEQVGEALGTDADEAAYAVAEVADEAMAQAAREHAVETGRSVAGRVLIAFGGSAPLHAARLADKLGIDRVLIPAQAGVGSALGFLHAPLAFEASQSLYQRLDTLDIDAVAAVLETLASRAAAVLAGLAPDAPRCVSRHAFLRYAGQGHELRVPVPDGALGSDAAAHLADAFATAYRERYGLTIVGARVEALGWTVRVTVDEGAHAQVADSRPVGAGPGHADEASRQDGEPVVPETVRAVLD